MNDPAPTSSTKAYWRDTGAPVVLIRSTINSNGEAVYETEYGGHIVASKFRFRDTLADVMEEDE